MAQIRINTDQMIAVANNFNSAVLDEKKNAMLSAMENINSSWSGKFTAKLENETEDVKKSLATLSEEIKGISAFLIAAVKAYCEADILGKAPIAEYNNGACELPKDKVDVTNLYLKEKKLDGFIHSYKQTDSRWGGEKLFQTTKGNTLASAGCVVSCVAMVLSYRYGKEITPHDINNKKYVKDGNVMWGPCGMTQRFVDKTKKEAGQQTCFKEIYKKLAEDKPVIVYAGGHAAVVTGCVGTNEITNKDAFDASCFTISDPGATRKTLQDLINKKGNIDWWLY